jgi:hypothetical protein
MTAKAESLLRDGFPECIMTIESQLIRYDGFPGHILQTPGRASSRMQQANMRRSSLET